MPPFYLYYLTNPSQQEKKIGVTLDGDAQCHVDTLAFQPFTHHFYNNSFSNFTFYSKSKSDHKLSNSKMSSEIGSCLFSFI